MKLGYPLYSPSFFIRLISPLRKSYPFLHYQISLIHDYRITKKDLFSFHYGKLSQTSYVNFFIFKISGSIHWTRKFKSLSLYAEVRWHFVEIATLRHCVVWILFIEFLGSLSIAQLSLKARRNALPRDGKLLPNCVKFFATVSSSFFTFIDKYSDICRICVTDIHIKYSSDSSDTIK